VPIESLLGRRDRRRVREHLSSVGPDLLHTHLGYSDFLGGLAARSLAIPSVSTIHVMEWGDSLRERSKERLMFLARRHCMARVITVSEAARRAYLATGWDRPDHVTTVNNGILSDSPPGGGGKLLRELGLADGDVVVAMVTVLRRGKGHDVAARAIAELREDHPNLKLLVLGDGPDRAEIERQLAVAGDAAVLAGFRDDVPAVLAEVDVLVHPSRIDAFPTALLDALASRTPVVATAVGGIPEIVTDGETGFLLEPPPTADSVAGALRRLLEQPDLRRRMGERGREVFEARFTAERWIERLLPVYEAALSGRVRRRTRVGSSPCRRG
jgi:glycosyltransferase involved in cell wall biosynthesis